MNLLVRHGVMDIGKALLSTQDLCRCGWETVFLVDCGDTYLVRKASGTRITLVTKRCAWYLRVKLKERGEACGLWKKEEAQAVVVQRGPQTSRRVRLCKSLWHHRPQQRRTGKSTQPAGMRCSGPGAASVASDVAECISIVEEEEKPELWRLPLTTVT